MASFYIPDAIYDFGGGNLTVTGAKATAGIFATYPAPYLSLHAGFIDQVDFWTPIPFWRGMHTLSWTNLWFAYYSTSCSTVILQVCVEVVAGYKV